MSDVEVLRQRAKQLLKAARAGDPVVISQLRERLPRLAALDDGAVQAQIKLADVQHAMARQRGAESWRALTRALEARDPVHVQAERFLAAVRDSHVQHAYDIAIAHPQIVDYSIHVAAALADVNAIARCLRADVSLATTPTLPDGTEPIVYAVLSDIKSRLQVPDDVRVEAVRLLLDAGANPNASVPISDVGDRIPILYFPSVNNQPTMVRLLLERGANPNDGESVYHAAERNHRDCLDVLLAFGADLSSTHSTLGNTPLYFLAAYREHNPIVATATPGMQWLLEHGADPNVPSYVGANREQVPGHSELPLHRVAASLRPASVARLLVEHGAAVDAPRGDGKTAYTMALRAGNTDVAAYLASVGANANAPSDIDRLVGGCARADESDARALLRARPDLVNTFTLEDRQALLAAIADNRLESARLMIALGWPLSTESEWGGTALHWATWHGRVALAELLIAHGAPINQRDTRYGSSPIAWAAHGSTFAEHDRDDDYIAIINRLLDAGATRAESYNQWNEAPEGLASPGVRKALKKRGFAV